MTSLLTILSIVGLITVCWIVGKFNKSDNLFWILLISLMAGMAGGAIAGKLNAADKKKTNFTQVYNPTQVSPANCVDFYTELGDALAYTAEPASKDVEIPAFGSKVSFAPSKVFGEIRGQPTFNNPQNKGTPGMPYNTS